MKKIYGKKPVFEAVKAGEAIDQIYILYNQHSKAVNEIKKLARRKGIKVTQLSQKKFNQLAGTENTQGVIAIVSETKLFSLDEILEEVREIEEPLLLIIDSVQDPHNLGAILRSAEAAGVNGVIMTTRNTAPLSETVVKTSTGAISHLKICRVNNLVDSMKLLKKNRFWIVGSALGSGKSYTEIDYSGPIALVVGNEEKGIRKLVAENCDFLVEIPMQGKIQSLNVSVATGILLFEILRQRSAKGLN